ncbi:MAG TPA: UbiX family flavin prenyltransferase [Nanoarchaeota archaeon]|nr:UbiX family flavin prenyltransferase [Nanoarchaeota archaeon]
MKLVLGITGASGVELAVKLAEILRKKSVELDIIISENAKKVFKYEVGIDEEKVNKLFSELGKVYHNNDFASKLASGSSFDYEGMIILPCSMKTLGVIANGIEINLISRAASVCLKEKKKLVLCIRETPLRVVHIENMLKLAREGAIILPLMMCFYLKEKSYETMLNNILGKILKIFNIDFEKSWKWK